MSGGLSAGAAPALADEQANLRAVRDILEGLLAGRWSMANAKHWLKEHVPEVADGEEDPATALARRALLVVRSRYGGAPREWVDEALIALLAGGGR